MNDEMKKSRGIKDGVYTEDSGLPPPQDIDGGSAPKPKPKPSKPKAFAKGGSTGSASKRADGIATKGKTRGTIC
jgi:hypothetical protein